MSATKKQKDGSEGSYKPPEWFARAMVKAQAMDLLTALGKRVREVWVAWAQEQPNPKPSWLKPWDELTDAEKDVDCRIGGTIYRIGYDAAQLKLEMQLGDALSAKLSGGLKDLEQRLAELVGKADEWRWAVETDAYYATPQVARSALLAKEAHHNEHHAREDKLLALLGIHPDADDAWDMALAEVRRLKAVGQCVHKPSDTSTTLRCAKCGKPLFFSDGGYVDADHIPPPKGTEE